MRHHRRVPPTSPQPAASDAGAVAAERYPLHEEPVLPLVIGGRAVIPVGALRMYTCGITPYDVTHVGHAATFVWADLVATLAHATGSEAVVARNVTDIDDVLTAAARRRGRRYDELAVTQEFLFDRDMRALSVAAPKLTPHAHANVVPVIRLAAALLGSGAAYEAGGYVYFRGAAVPASVDWDEDRALVASRDYGDQDDVPNRESVFDVPVWRPSTAEHPAWPSPWGWGRPGWHAECAAMALCSLGPAIDVLVGGADLTFPHHAYQVAMAEAATGTTPFAGTVLHVGEVRLGGAKMSKSTGNLTLVGDLVTRFPAAAVRLGLLNRRWDEPWECEDTVFEAAAETLGRLTSLADGTGEAEDGAEVVRVLATELDVPGAVRAALDSGPAAARLLIGLLKLR
jgi:cysteinyl-tRNA synthetase